MTAAANSVSVSLIGLSGSGSSSNCQPSELPAGWGLATTDMLAHHNDLRDDVLAVGEYLKTYVTLGTLAESWNGEALTVGPPIGGIRTAFNAVRCPSATLCFAVGHSSALRTTRTQP